MTKYYTPINALPKYKILEGQSRLNTLMLELSALMLELCEIKPIITNIPFTTL